MTLQSSKSPIGLDGVPAAETALSHVDGQKGELIIAGERGRGPRRQVELRRRHGAAVDGGDRHADQRGGGPRGAGRGTGAGVPARPDLPRRERGTFHRRRHARRRRDAARRARADAGRDHRRRPARHRRRAGEPRQGPRAAYPERQAEPCGGHALHAARPRAQCGGGGGARRLFRDRERPRDERLDLHGAGHRLDPGGSLLRRHRRLLRPDRAPARRRARAGAGDARCHRHTRAHRALDRRRAGARRTADGLRPPRLQGARSARPTC